LGGSRGFELESIPATNLAALEMWNVAELDQGSDKFNALVVEHNFFLLRPKVG